MDAGRQVVGVHDGARQRARVERRLRVDVAPGHSVGGAVVGKELADRGYAVVFVEEGGHHQRKSFTGSSVQAHFDFYRGSLTLGNAPMPIFMGRLVGGSTAINTGSSFRTPPWVLDRWNEDIGTDAFEPETMRPHFEREPC